MILFCQREGSFLFYVFLLKVLVWMLWNILNFCGTNHAGGCEDAPFKTWTNLFESLNSSAFLGSLLLLIFHDEAQ